LTKFTVKYQNFKANNKAGRYKFQGSPSCRVAVYNRCLLSWLLGLGLPAILLISF